MVTSSKHLAAIDEAVVWLNANPQVSEQAIEALKLQNLRLCDAITLRPQTYLDLASNTYTAAVAAGASKNVQLAMKTQVKNIKAGLAKLPKLAHTWMVITQLRDANTKAKARSILLKASAVAPDKANRDALAMASDAVFRCDITKPTKLPTSGGPAQLRPAECVFCCMFGCAGCGPFCWTCCAIGCIVCG